MWFITTLIASIIATLCFYIFKKKYKLGLLSLMLWGATVMILVDHILGYEGGQFFETKTDGLIESGTWLGIVMLVPVFLIWLAATLIPRINKGTS
ncbi:MAG: hypothetical protein ABIG60_05135 [Patescibacteria group bacterium]